MHEDTRNLDAPDAAALVEAMLELVASEAEALLVGGTGTDVKLAELNVRTALASWDALHQTDEALRFLELAEGHPLAPRLRFAAALAAGDPLALETIEGKSVASPALAIELAEAWLWRHGRPDRAAPILDRLVDPAGAELPAGWRAHAVELAVLAHGALGAWTRVIDLRRRHLDEDSEPQEVAATAALQLDRGDDAVGALETCWAKLAHDPGTATAASAAPHALGWLRVYDIAVDAATVLDDDRRFELLERRAARAAALPAGDLEALATRHAVASELDRDAQPADAAALWARLADDPAATIGGAARRIALVRAAWSAMAAGTGRAVAPGTGPDLVRALAAHRALAEGECLPASTAHAWRALELAAIVAPAAMPELARAVAAASASPIAERWLDHLELRAPTASTIARFEARGGLGLRWAAALAEQRGERARATGLWRRAAVESMLPTTRDHVVRLLRGDATATGRIGGEGITVPEGEPLPDPDDLAVAYAAWAKSEPDPRTAAALWCARGIVDLARGDFVEAEESLTRAAELAATDPFCRAALAAVYRAGKRYNVLAQTLAELAGVLTSADARAAVARERAILLDEHFADRAGARAALEAIVADRPDDGDTMLALATLCERDRAFERASVLRRRAADLAPTAARRSAIWADAARVDEARGDRDAARAALERVVEAVRTELAAAPASARRLALQRELARTLTILDRDPAAVVAAYLDVLAVEPDQSEALVGIERPARQLGLWDELARAFRRAPRTPRTTEVLGEALVHLAAWPELAELRRRQLDSATTPAERSERAAQLAALHEQQLGDVDGAIRHLQLALAAVPDDSRQRDLVRLLRARERWAELSAALESELARVPATDAERSIALLLELADVNMNRLDRPTEAAQAYERVIERRPGDPTADAALERLYAQLGRDGDLARLLDARTEAITDPVERGQMYGRVAALRSSRGDIDGALAAYTAAFKVDPTNREVFTAMERVCYKAERWAVAMELYQSAIEHIESGASRAYRLGDLYARRGNVQQQFLGQLDAAIESYQKVIEVDSQPAAAVKALEDLCKQRGDVEPLLAAWVRRAATQKDATRRVDALRAAALIAIEQGDTRKAMRLYVDLLAIDPADPVATAAVESHYEGAVDKTGLVDLLKQQLSSATGGQSMALHRRIARASEEGARDVVGATDAYLKMLELEPENRDALEALSRIYESTEQWAELVEVTRRLVKVTTDRATKALLYFRCGSVMEAKFGRDTDAIRYYEAAIKTASSCLPAVHGLRDLYRRREDWPRVIETLELEVKLWQEDKERAGVFAQIGSVYDQHLADSERALQYYDSALAVDPDCLPANQALFEHYFTEGAWAKAAPLADALAQKAMREGDPSTRSEFYRKRGVVSRMTGDLREAAESFIVALEVKPVNGTVLEELGSLARAHPDAWEFESTYRELEKVYKKRDDADGLLARVHVARAKIVERAGDLDTAADLYRQALELAPSDVTVMSALVEFHTDMRHWSEAIAAIETFGRSAASTPADRIAALMRRAEIHADCELDPERAIAVLHQVIAAEPAHQDAWYWLAQQHFLVESYGEAREAIERVIELATASGQPLSATALARYYYYKGRILDGSGDARAAASQYRRASEYDPGYAPPALVLARRAAEGGDQQQAETLLIDAAHAAMERGGATAAVPLQRGLARILLASGDRPAAIEAYRGILAVEPDGASDRVALAEIYAVDDPPRAIIELRKVLERDIHHAPAYRLLAMYYKRIGDVERASRVLTALDLLGFAEEVDRLTSRQIRAVRVSRLLRHTLDDDAREQYLLTPTARDPLGEVWQALAEPISALVPQPSFGSNLQPATGFGDARILALASEVGRLYGVEAEVFIAEKVPGLAAVTAFPRKLVVLDRVLLEEEDAPLRFLFGYAFEAIRGGYATLLQLGARQRRELAQLLRALMSPEGQTAGAAGELVGAAGEPTQALLERIAIPDTDQLDPAGWIDGMLAQAKRAGLVACDDFAPAIWMVARLTGETLPSVESTVALGSVLGGPDLVRFYLSDDYQALRDSLAG